MMRPLVGLALVVLVAGCDLVFSPGKGPGGDDTPGEWIEQSSGLDHACAIGSDRSLWCWGHNDVSELGDNTTVNRNAPVRIGGTATWSHVSGGYYHTCGIQTDGSLFCWGYDFYGELGSGAVQPRSAPAQIVDHAGWSEVSAGSRFTCAIKTGDSSLWCWGDNEYGELGNGLTNPSATPLEVAGGGEWLHVGAGGTFACAIKADGGMWCWGNDTYGQLGTLLGDSPTPVQVGTDRDWTAIAAGDIHACGLRAGGAARCWGYNGDGQCGDGTTGGSCTPAPISAPVASWRAIDAGFRHTCGVDDNGGMWCWGGRDRGAFGDGSEAVDSQPVPAPIASPRTYATVSLGTSFGCALGDDGAIDCTGANGYGQLGDGSGAERYQPARVLTTSAATAITTGGPENGSNDFSCATLGDGVWCWGNDELIQFGDNAKNDARVPVHRDTTTPEVLEGGARHGCELLAGELLCWGNNGHGEIGDGTNDAAQTPLSHGAGWTAVSAMYHTCAIDTAFGLYCWGFNQFNQVGDGSGIDQTTPAAITISPVSDVAAGARHTCALDTAGYLWSWGANDEGELGLGDNDPRATPTQSVARQWAEIDAGDYHSCGIAAGSAAMFCWGWNVYDQLGTGVSSYAEKTPMPVMAGVRWKHVSTGGNHTCAIAENSTLWCWGANGFGQVGVATPSLVPAPVQIGTATWNAVDAAEAHTCGIHATDGSVWCWGYDAHGEIGDGSAWRPSLGPIGN